MTSAKDPKTGRFVRADAKPVLHRQRLDACKSGNHPFVDGVCVDCDVLAPFEGRTDLHEGPPPAPKPQDYQADRTWQELLLFSALLIVIVGAALLAVGVSQGFSTIGSGVQ